LQKKKEILSNIWNLNFKLSKIKGLIQVLATTLEKHNYINLAFETNANNNEKKMCPKKLILISQTHLLFVFFICKPLIFV